jgi:hypothetical protein
MDVQRRALALARAGDSLDARAVVSRIGGRYRLVLHVQSARAQGERTLDADTCDVVAESAAVIIAMSGTSWATAGVGPEEASLLGSAAPTEEPTPEPQVAPPVQPPAPDRPAAASEPVHREPLPGPARVRLLPFASLDVGSLPSAAIGGGVGVGVAITDRLTVGAAGALWTQRDGTLQENTQQGAEFDLVTGGLRGCYAVTRGRFELSPCALAGIAWSKGRGFGAVHVSEASAAWVSVGAGVQWRWEMTRALALALELDALVSTSRPTFVILAAGTVHQPGAVVGRVLFGPEVRF